MTIGLTSRLKALEPSGLEPPTFWLQSTVGDTPKSPEDPLFIESTPCSHVSQVSSLNRVFERVIAVSEVLKR